MGQSLSVPSKGGASPSKDRSNPTNALAPREQQLPQKAQNQGVAGTLKGWWDKGTSWMGEKYDQASEAVSGAYNAVKETVTDFADIYQNSDMSYKDGKFSASTDMDEVMDVLPASIREKLTLDKSLPSANKATLDVDTCTGKLALKVPNLMMSSMNLGGVSAGKTKMSGVVLTVDNAGALAHDYAQKKAGSTVADFVFGKQQNASGIDCTTTLKVASVLANDVAYAAGGMSAKQLELSGLDVSIFNQGGGLPGADASPDKLQMNFSVGSAVVRGLNTPTSSANELGISGVSGKLDQLKESGDVAAGRIHASGLVHNGDRLGSGQITDLKSHIGNRGGGLPFLDQNQDQLQTSGTVGAAQLNGLDTKQAKASSAQVQGLGWSQGQQTSVSADRAHVEGASSALGTVKSGDLNGVNTRFGGGSLSASVAQGSLAGLDTDDIDASTLGVQDLSFSQGDQGKKLQVSSAKVTGLESRGQTLGTGSVQGLIATKGADGSTAGSLVGATLSDLDTESLDAKHASIAGLQYAKGKDGTAVDVQSADLTGLDAAGTKVASAKVAGLSATQKGDNFSVSLGSGTASGIDSDTVDAGLATVQDVRLLKDEKGMQGSVGAATVDGLDTTSVDVGHGEVAGLSFQKDNQGMSGSVESLSAQKLAAGAATVGSLDAQKLAGGQSGGRISGSAAGVQVQGVKAGDTSVDQASLSGISGSKEGEKVAVSLDQGQGTGVSAAGGSVGKLSVNALNASGDLGSNSGALSVGSLEAQKLKHNAGSAEAVSLQGLSASGGKTAAGMEGKMSLDQGKVAGLDTAALDARTVDLGGVIAAISGDQKSGSVKTASATGISANGGGMQVGVEKLEGRDLSGSTTAGGKATAAPSGPTPAALAGLVDSAHLRGSVPLNAGEVGPVEIKKDTHANFNLDVAGGRIDPRTTRVAIDKPLDDLLWVTVKGAYLDDQGKDRAKLKTDLGGWKDMNVSDKLPGGQDTIPLRLDQLAKENLPSTPRSPSMAPPSSGPGFQGRAGSLSASGISVNGTLPGEKTPPPSGGVADLDHTTVAGTVGLKSGKADLGSVKADLMRQDAQDNSATVSANGASNLALQFTRLLVGSFSVDTGSAAVKSGKSSMEDGKVSVKEGKAGKQVQGTIGSVKVENVEGVRR